MQGTRWTTINAKIDRTRRTVFTTPRETEFLNGDNVRKINDKILMLVETRNVIPKKRNNDETLDQRVDPSNIAMVNVDNVKDLENLEHVLSIVEYEPRKINKKEKRKIVDTFNDNLDTITYSNENTNPVTPDVTSLYYEVPRTIEPNKITITPQYDTRANQHAPKSLKTEQNPKSQNREYKYPVTTFKRKSSRIHMTSNSSPTTSPSDISYSTKANKRKKTRKRMKNKSLTKQEASRLLENVDNYPRAEESINDKGKNKSRKLGLQIKYNIEPRPFSSVIKSAEKSQESNLEKFDEVNSNVSDKNYSNAMKINDDYSKDYSKIVDPVKISSSESKRKLYEENSTVKNKPSTSTDRNESFKSNRDNPSYKNVQTTERDDFFESESSTTVTQSYKNIPAIIDSMNPIVSTPIPSTESNLYSSSHMYYYPPLLPTMAPQRQFEVKSTVENESKIDDSNEDKENTKEDNEEIKKASSDDVTVVTTSENDENRKYEIRKDEDHQTEDRQNNRKLPETEEDNSERYKKYEDKGYRRYAHKYNDKMEEEEEEDVVSDGTHDNESHQSVKEGAADDASGKGGEKKFEKGGATEQEQEHHKSEGEKGKKVYKSWDENEKANKGHQDKERQSNYYDEKDGDEKEHKEEGGYHEEHQKDEKGEKQAEFDEKGEHQKGYNTKGQHSVHEKDEFEKRTEFFDEFHEDGDMEKEGELYGEHKMSKGGHYKSGHHNEGDEEGKYGKEGKYAKGDHHYEDKGYKVNEGKDSHHEYKNMHGEKKDHKDGKKWSYKKGDDEKGGEKNH
ncbi:glutamic acid-rich protein-like [Apis laboriosa]|uniref:glutamic acid-rich protein-like n=1 Tax=Apis laboriosa TaxID=183418 RepID=UPI001CC82FF3|nr:glutamic acid-rich protein-like [Apis laboriosa]